MAIHPTAIIDPKAQLDPSVEVGPYCIIDGNVRVGPGCRLYQGVYLTGWTEIGENCVLHPGVIVGHSPQDVKYGGARTYCRIGQGTVIREYATIHRGTKPDSETVVGEHCFLLAGCHVAHNCTIGNRVTIVNNVLLAGHVQVGDRAFISGGSVVHQFVRVGELVMIQGNSGVGMDLVPFATIDTFGRVAGLNSVGIRRAEIPAADVRDLRLAFRTLFGSGLLFSKAVERLAGEVTTPSGKKLLQFVQAPSERGFAGRRTLSRRG